jgi:hypothetical protein
LEGNEVNSTRENSIVQNMSEGQPIDADSAVLYELLRRGGVKRVRSSTETPSESTPECPYAERAAYQAMAKMRTGAKDARLSCADRYAILENGISAFEVHWPVTWANGNRSAEQVRHVKALETFLALARRVLAATATHELIAINNEYQAVIVTGQLTKIITSGRMLLEHMIMQRNWTVCRKANENP